MTNLEIINLNEGTRVRIKKNVDCAESYKKGGKLSFWNVKRTGKTEVNADTGELEIYYPFGIEDSTGVCYFFPASDYELIN